MTETKDRHTRRVQVVTDLHALGFNLLPIMRGEKRPPNTWAEWQFTRQSLEDVLALNWGDGVGGIGAVCGDVSDSSACVDVDKADGPQALADILEALGLPESYPWAVRTPGGGYHVWVRSPGLGRYLNGKGKLVGTRGGCDHLELRYNKHQTLLPPSAHPNGGAYAFVTGNGTPPVPPSLVAPDVLIGAATWEPQAVKLTTMPTLTTARHAVPDAYLEAALQGEAEMVRQAPEGTRNDALNKAAFSLGQLEQAGLSHGDAETFLVDAAVGVGLTEGEARKTFRSGWEHGCQEPRTMPGRDRPQHQATRHATPITSAHGADVDGSAGPTPTSSPASLGHVVDTMRRWYYLPDPGPLYVVLAVIVANLLSGDPVWLLLVGPPGIGKTELLHAVSGLPYVKHAATMTEAALLSGTSRKEKVANAHGGLLREIGDFGILVMKDFTSILSMNRDARAGVLAALREVFDGSWTRLVGTDGGQTMHWSGKVGLLAGVTPAIDSHHAVMASMGERFLLYRMGTQDSAEQSRRALAHSGRESAMRRELAEVVTVYFAGLALPTPPGLTSAEVERLVDIASLVAHARSAVERDSYRREIELIPDSEAPTRLAVTLAALLGGLRVIGVPDPEAWTLISRVALDSVPNVRRKLLELLIRRGGSGDTTELANAAGYPATTVRRALEDLTCHSVVWRQPKADRVEGEKTADLWHLTDWTRDRVRAVSEMSEDMQRVPEMSENMRTAPSLTNTIHAFDDFSGTQESLSNSTPERVEL